MTIFFLILIILCAVILGFLVLVQNPKGGGLQGNVAGFGNQFMGVKQTTDILEKGTWIFASVIALLCIASSLFFSAPNNNRALDRTQGTAAPAATQPKTNTTIPATPPAQKAP